MRNGRSIALDEALDKIEIDLRQRKVDRRRRRAVAADRFATARAHCGVDRLSLTLPQIHRGDDGAYLPAADP